MLSLDDIRWNDLKGGHRTRFDPRPLLLTLEAAHDVKTVWRELWNELHHQGDVGEASYAAVPHLVRIYRQSRSVDWNTYAIVAVIELARGKGKNPQVPEWMAGSYSSAIDELSQIGAIEILRATNLEDVRAILSILAIAKGARTHARFLIEYSEDELLDIESRPR
jgi:hypothetical protein